jgi:hypothetical protein
MSNPKEEDSGQRPVSVGLNIAYVDLESRQSEFIRMIKGSEVHPAIPSELVPVSGAGKTNVDGKCRLFSDGEASLRRIRYEPNSRRRSPDLAEVCQLEQQAKRFKKYGRSAIVYAPVENRRIRKSIQNQAGNGSDQQQQVLQGWLQVIVPETVRERSSPSSKISEGLSSEVTWKKRRTKP